MATAQRVSKVLNAPERERREPSWWQILARDRIAVAALVILAIIFLFAIFASVIAQFDPNRTQSGMRLLPPSQEHLFGTDAVGRDVFTRTIYGGRLSLAIGLVSVALGLLVGGTLGLLAGYFSKLDNFIMRLMDIMLALPGIILAIAVVAALGPGLYQIMIAIGVTTIPTMARLIRSSVLSVRENLYVEAAKSVGASNNRVIFNHILPNSFAPILVYTTLRLATAILSASYLSFLGLGPQPPTAEWGAMVNAGRRYMFESPYLVLFPSIAIFLVVICFNLVGDSLRDALDPRLRGQGR